MLVLFVFHPNEVVRTFSICKYYFRMHNGKKAPHLELAGRADGVWGTEVEIDHTLSVGCPRMVAIADPGAVSCRARSCWRP